MSLILLLIAPLAVADTNIAEQVVAALNEPGCPRLFTMYADNMRQASPKDENAKFCNGVRDAKGTLLKAEHSCCDLTAKWAAESTGVVRCDNTAL